MTYLSLSQDERTDMLKTIGVRTFDELIRSVPEELRNPAIDLPAAVNEIALRKDIEARAAKNLTTRQVLSFMGGGAYEHFIPSIVSHITSRSEFYTAYTPYQAEASQGTLQAMYEYQTMMCSLTGMAVSNASHYDGATSMAEAALMSLASTRRKKVLISHAIHPEYRKVLESYLKGTDITVAEIPYDTAGRIDQTILEKCITSETACFIAQSPNFFGVIEDFTAIEKVVHQTKAHLVIVANPLSLARLKSPGEWGADIACGDAQVFGNPLSFGGPYLGYIATTKELMRKVPGRLVGMSTDKDGKRMYTLTLQAREQHIRRERATSNICSNQALCAVAAVVYLSALGKHGVEYVADCNIHNMQYLKEKMSKISGCDIVFDGPVFNEIVVQFKKDVRGVVDELHKEGIHPGIELDTWYPELKNSLVVCATETKTHEDLDTFIAALKKVIK